MEIARERFMDDSRFYHLTLSLRSRTAEMHSALTALSADEREQVSAALSTALDEIQRLIAKRVPEARVTGAM